MQRTYEEFARHYGTTVLPARPKHPRDKAKVEVAVLVAQRWVLARLRHETFFSLGALNARIAELLADLNDRVMRGYGMSRRVLFESIERSALRPLPVDRFEFAHWKAATVVDEGRIDVDVKPTAQKAICRQREGAEPSRFLILKLVEAAIEAG